MRYWNVLLNKLPAAELRVRKWENHGKTYEHEKELEDIRIDVGTKATEKKIDC